MRQLPANFKILIALVCALLLTNVLSKTLFNGMSPRLNTVFIASAIQHTKDFLATAISGSKNPQVKVDTGSVPTATPIIAQQNSPSSSPSPNNNQQNPTGALSNSKLGIFILSNYSGGARSIISAGPRAIKVMDPQSNPGLMQAVIDYKNQFAGKVILRIYTPNYNYGLNNDPEASATDYFNRAIQPALNQLGQNLKYFDYLESPNEAENIPDWETVDNVNWLSKFWSKLASLNNQAGIGTCAGSISVGGVGGNTTDEIGQRIGAFVPTLRLLKSTNGAWCYHAYTLQYSQDPNVEMWYSLRYRIFYNYLKANAQDVANIPMILSEAGVDQSGDPKSSGWQARGTKNDYENWLGWFDSQIKNDGYIIGATLFQIGDNTWSSFNLEPISSWLTDYLLGKAQPPGGSGGGGNGGGGGGGPPKSGTITINFDTGNKSAVKVGIGGDAAYTWVNVKIFNQQGQEVQAGVDGGNPQVCIGGRDNCNNSGTLNPQQKRYLWIYTASNLTAGTYKVIFQINCDQINCKTDTQGIAQANLTLN